MSSFSLGLRARIAIALAVVLAVFILVTEVSITRVLELSLGALGQQPGVEAALGRGRRLVLFYLALGAATTLAVGSFVLWRLVVQPVQRITRAVESVAEGDLRVRARAEGASELLELAAAFNHMAETLSRQRAEIDRRIRELEDSRAELATAQDRLIRAAKLASVGTLAAGVAHEIGNPLAGLLGLLDALETETDAAKTTRYRELMRLELRRIDSTIAGLLAYARPSPEIDGAQPTCSVEEVLAHVQALLAAQRVFSQVRVAVTSDRGGHCVAVSRDDLTQLLVNLLLNAAQAMDGRGEIRIDLGEAGAQVQLSVADSGPGVKAEHAQHIFDPFFTTKTLGKGTGLGLAICHSICERCGGSIELDQGAASGARFTVRLPGA